VFLIKSLELLQRQQLSITQQFGASVFYMVVCWHKLHKVDNECTLHNSIVLTISVTKIIKFGADLTKFWRKQFGSLFGTPCSSPVTSCCTEQICKVISGQTSNLSKAHEMHDSLSSSYSQVVLIHFDAIHSWNLRCSHKLQKTLKPLF